MLEVATLYLISILLLLVVIAAFFLWPEGRFRPFGRLQWALRALVALTLVFFGIAHFVHTSVFAAIVPPIFPHPAFWVKFTGALEIAGALGLVLPKFTRTASTCIALLMVLIFPANIYAAHRTVGGLHMPGVPLRLAMQIAYILLVLLAGWGMPHRKKSK